MTKDDLKKMTQDVLVMPFSDEIAQALHEFCKTQTGDMNINKMSTLLMGMLSRTDESGLYNKVYDYLTDNDIKIGFNLKVIVPILQEYIILTSIEEKGDSREMAIYSLLVKNALLGVVKGNAIVTHIDALSKVFGIYKKFLADEKSYEEGDGNDLIEKVLDNDSLSFHDEGDANKLKSLIFDAACYRYQKLKEDMNCDGDTDVKKVYGMVDTLVSQSPWIYAENSITNSLTELFGRFGIQDKMYGLKEMVVELQSKMVDNTEVIYNPTSLILRMINKEHVGIGLMDDSVKMNLKEFAVYLYYELLTEHFLDNNKKKEE